MKTLRVIGILIILLLIFLWIFFPRLHLEKEQATIQPNTQSQTIAFHFKDPIQWLRKYFSNEPKIIGIEKTNPNQDNIINKVLANEIQFSKPNNLGCGNNYSERLTIHHTAKNDSKLVEINSKYEKVCDDSIPPAPLVAKPDPISQCIKDGSYKLTSDTNNISLYQGIKNAPNSIDIPITFEPACAGDLVKDSLKINNLRYFNASILTNTSPKIVRVALNKNNPSYISETLYIKNNEKQNLIEIPLNGFSTPSNTIQFPYDSSELSEIAKQTIEKHKAFINLEHFQNTLYLSIEGHADYRGTDEYNLALSTKRAEIVKTFLQKKNISTKGLGFHNPIIGKENPCAEGEKSKCESKRVSSDRRAEIIYEIKRN